VPQHNTITELLATERVVTPAASFAPIAAAARAWGLPFFIGEGNSVSCGGQVNVSDVFGAALWAVDSLLTHAEVGVLRWNFHGCPEGAYTAIAYANTSADAPDVRPLFYGMLAFTVATRDAELFDAKVTSTNGLVRAHVARTSSGGWIATVIHKDPGAAGAARATLRLPAGARGAGVLVRLLAPENDVLARRGLTFRGQTFDGTTDGTPSGAEVTEKVAPAADGTYAFDVAPGSVAILTIA
jgi:hypothetical protein